jgi:predicted RNA binding protein YcfA (HicA-like mRNA interferase family)
LIRALKKAGFTVARIKGSVITFLLALMAGKQLFQSILEKILESDYLPKFYDTVM